MTMILPHAWRIAMGQTQRPLARRIYPNLTAVPLHETMSIEFVSPRLS